MDQRFFLTTAADIKARVLKEHVSTAQDTDSDCGGEDDTGEEEEEEESGDDSEEPVYSGARCPQTGRPHGRGSLTWGMLL